MIFELSYLEVSDIIQYSSIHHIEFLFYNVLNFVISLVGVKNKHDSTMILRQADIRNLTSNGYGSEKHGPLEQYADEPTVGEIFSDYFLGTVMFLSFTISTVLNPLTFLFNYKQEGRLKVIKILFMLLSLSDFLTNIYRPLIIGYRFVSPDVYPFIREKTIGESVESIYFRLVTFSSLVLTSFISICRFISVKFPFFNISTRAVISIYLGLIMAGAVFIHSWLVTGFPIPSESGVYALYAQMASVYTLEVALADTPAFLTHNIVNCLLGMAGLTTSLLTVRCLIKKTGQTGNENSVTKLKKSSQAVLIMNFGNVIMITIQVCFTCFGTTVPLITVLGAFGFAIFLSAFNPLVRICLSKEMQDFALSYLNLLKTRFGSG